MYKVFEFESTGISVRIRPEQAMGWYACHDNAGPLWVVTVNLKDSFLRLKMPENLARDLVSKLSDFVADYVNRSTAARKGQ